MRTPSTMSLQCLEASARLGSFTRAGQELHLTQGAVSRQIIALEKRLGVALFSRQREALVPTEAGRYYLDEISPLLQRLQRATAHVMALKGKGGALALSVSASLGSYWLIPRLPAFTRAHSEITLHLATRVGAVNFSTTPVDASLEFGDGKRAGFQNDFVLPLQLAPYASPTWIKVNGKALTDQTPGTALIHHSTVLEGWPGWFKAAGIPLNASTDGPRYDLMSMALNAAVAGLGVVLLPAFMAEDAVSTGRLKPVSRRTWQSAKGYYLVYPETGAQFKPLQTFRAWLLGQISQ